MSAVTTAFDAGVLSVRLDRPEKKNAFDHALRDGLFDALERAGESDVRCVVLSGAGDSFCAGGDIDLMRERHERDVSAATYRQELVDTGHDLVASLYHLAVPTIAKVDGPALGAGCSIAMACDLVYASERSRFGFTFATVGLGPDTGASFLLPRLVGQKRALELFYTGELLAAEQAAEEGLVTDVLADSALDDAVDDVADRLATGPTASFAASKRLVHENADRDFDAALAAEADSQALLTTTRDHQEGVAAFLEDREPTFEGF